ncbi:hypothetical protein ACGFZP_31295 [Kitasatospora sp. NPDC048239]|uniref:hypothetical protein n=1 Tax=Kitasatospora sp. NPDC048239 TaxID=3364046 RepID=UPI00371171EA
MQTVQPAVKQSTSLTVETTKGRLQTFSARAKCRLTSKGKPLPFEDIDWYVGNFGEYLTTTQTDDHGIAVMEEGSFNDFGTSISGEFSGISAKYQGGDQYLSSEARGRIVPIFSIF